jgi:hypothetical protein
MEDVKFVIQAVDCMFELICLVTAHIRASWTTGVSVTEVTKFVSLEGLKWTQLSVNFEVSV